MVEIIEAWRKPGDQSYESKCRECSTRFRFKRTEAEYVSDRRDGDCLVIPCPLCGVDVWHAV